MGEPGDGRTAAEFARVKSRIDVAAARLPQEAIAWNGRTLVMRPLPTASTTPRLDVVAIVAIVGLGFAATLWILAQNAPEMALLSAAVTVILGVGLVYAHRRHRGATGAGLRQGSAVVDAERATVELVAASGSSTIIPASDVASLEVKGLADGRGALVARVGGASIELFASGGPVPWDDVLYVARVALGKLPGAVSDARAAFDDAQVDVARDRAREIENIGRSLRSSGARGKLAWDGRRLTLGLADILAD